MIQLLKFSVGTALLFASAISQISSADDISKVVSVVDSDFNKDGVGDRAQLLINDNGNVDLYLYLGKDIDPTVTILELVEVVKDAAFYGISAGQEAYLEIDPETGSLLVQSQNESIGRSRWNMVVKVAYRNEAAHPANFYVAGLTYNDRDTLDLDMSTACDVNLFRGVGTIQTNGGPVRTTRFPSNKATLLKDFPWESAVESFCTQD